MGIPVYYKNIVEDYPEIISPLKNIKVNNLFLDLNCAIHPCCANKTDENEMYLSIFEKIIECIELTNVKDLVYIAIDGAAPRSKMEQQRQRRLKSLKEKKIWDTNQITPGTTFMNNLSIFLQKKCKNLNVKIIISDSNEPGEGEHKIMKKIDELSLNDINIVYGLDADLIMLSMIRKNNNIYLLRERSEYNIEKCDDNYIYCNISLLKKYLIQSLNQTKLNISNNTLLYDYLFICFLIGNDFITNSPAINIRYNGLNNLIDVYIHLQKEYNGMFYLLTDDQKIHFDHFKIYIQKLASNETNYIQKIIEIRNNQSRKYKNIYKGIYEKCKTVPLEKIDTLDHTILNTTEDLMNGFKNHSPIIFKINEKEIFKNEKNYYMINFYNHTNYNPSFNDRLKEDCEKLCHEYLSSIQWTLEYYFHDCKDWRWHYKYHFAPLLNDIYKYMDQLNTMDDLIKNKTKPYSPKEQLKIVLPNQEDTYYYPKTTPLYSLFKRYLWECHPIMPQ